MSSILQSHVTETLLRETAIAVLQVQAEAAPDEAFERLEQSGLDELTFEELGIDSLAVAEIVVELEDHLGVLLELAAGIGLRTLADLHRALQPAGTS